MRVILPDKPRHLHAAQFRHLPVQQHQIIRFALFFRLPHQRHHFLPVRHIVHRHTCPRHTVDHIFTDIFIIVRDNDPLNTMLFPKIRLFFLYPGPQLQHHGKHGTLAQGTFHFYRTAHQVHQIAGNRHAQPCPLYLVGTRILFPGKRIKNYLLVLFGHTLSVIFYPELYTAVPFLHFRQFADRHFDSAALLRIFHRI